jgi:dienelactone hydrolase
MEDVEAVKRTVDIGDARLDYVEAGSGDVIISIGDDGAPDLYKSDIIFAKQRRVLRFNVRGHSPNYQSMAERINVALEKLQLDHFDLIGYGAGAVVALWLAKLSGASVRSIILVAPKEGPDGIFDDLQCPVLTLFGTKDEAVSLERKQIVRLRPPHSHLMYVYDSGSTIGTDRPEALAFMAFEFFEHRDQFLVSRENGLVFP